MQRNTEDFKPAGIEYLSDEEGLCLIDLHDHSIMPMNRADFQQENICEDEISFEQGIGKSSCGYQSEEKKPKSSANIKRTKRNKEGSPIVFDDLRKAACQGNLMQLEHFLNNGVAVDTSLRAGWTALMYAAFHAQVRILEFLLDRGANANFSKASYMYTPLLAAASSVQKKYCVTSCITILLKRGADPNQHERSHMTPLMLVSKNGNVDAVDKLLKSGAQIDRQDNRGWTALCYAADQGLRDIVECLLNAEADIYKRCSEGTAKDIAFNRGHSELAELIDSRGGSSFGNSERPHFRLHHLPHSLDIRSAEIQQPRKKMSSNPEQQNDDLDLFLYGLGLGHLAPYFQQHEVSFSSLLCMSEEGLIKIGVNKYGWRCKILNALHEIHKKKWEPGSLRAPSTNMLSPNESLVLIKNVCKHLVYIESSMNYLCNNWKTHHTLMDNHQDPSYLGKLEKESNKALINTRNLFEELKKVRGHLKEVTCMEMSVPADLIIEPDCAPVIGRKLKGIFALSSIAATIILLCRMSFFRNTSI